MDIGTVACPAYDHAFVSTDSTKLFTWHPQDSVQAFDKALLDYVGSDTDSNEFQTFMRCKNYKPDQLKNKTDVDSLIPAIKYRRSIVCAQVIAGTDNLSICYNNTENLDSLRENLINVKKRNSGEHFEKRVVNQSNQITSQTTQSSTSTPSAINEIPLPLCKSTCILWAKSLTELYRNQNSCPNSLQVDKIVVAQRISSLCEEFPLSGIESCVTGDQIELDTCGYRNVLDWCKSCDKSKNFKEECASDIDTSKFQFFNSTSLETYMNAKKNQKNNNTTITENNSGLGNDKNRNNEGFDANNKNTSSDNNGSYKTLATALGVIMAILLIALIALLLMMYSGYKNRKNNKWNPVSGFSKKDPFERNSDSKLIVMNTRTNQNHIIENNENSKDFVDFFLKNVGKPRTVIHPFFAKREDEITLKVDDSVQIQIAFDDGWVVGKNLTTGEEGSFPMMCVIKNIPSELPKNWSNLENKRDIETYGNTKRSSMKSIKTHRNSGYGERENEKFDSQKIYVGDFDGVDKPKNNGNNRGITGENVSKLSFDSEVDSKRSSNTKSSVFMSNPKPKSYAENEKTEPKNNFPAFNSTRTGKQKFKPNVLSIESSVEIPENNFGFNKAKELANKFNQNQWPDFVPKESSRYNNTVPNSYFQSDRAVPQKPLNTMRK
ncbi:hypothetical protein BB558_004580 [Smittium angustum]|uniref:SH3 domain-containing protein n=1 Tax=Smittium angustum TaxID=133377 RepID=A0A2U1J2U4_SMIAN|nr:hypothetical protein BB558_006442 [Smittium angustum]PVZ99401.1 hypothetical protein BB558_004580 [Smittium angustum]